MAVSALLLAGCGAGSPVAKKPIDQSGNGTRRQAETVAAHSVDKEKDAKNLPAPGKVENSKNKTKWTRSGDPIDTSKLDEAISKAQASLKKSENDPAGKAALAEAFFNRGFALTEARQYASAIGDYRRALKQVPGHAESKKWINTISGIYKSMNKEIPPEGEEPPPLEVKKVESGK